MSETRDHVFPKAWFPGSYPLNLWTVPAHKKCNATFKVYEDEIFVRLGLLLQPGVQGAEGIKEKAIRAMDPMQGRNMKDSAYREQLRKRVLGDVVENSMYNPDKMYKSGLLSITPGMPCSQILIRPEALEKVVEKLIKGILYIENNLYVDSSIYTMEVVLLKGYTEYATELSTTLNPFKCFTSHKGPGIVIDRYSTLDDPRYSLFKIYLWQHFTIYATLVPN